MFSCSILLSKTSFIPTFNKNIGLTIDAQRVAMINSDNPFNEIGEGLSILQYVNPSMIFDDLNIENVVGVDRDVVITAMLHTVHDI